VLGLEIKGWGSGAWGNRASLGWDCMGWWIERKGKFSFWVWRNAKSYRLLPCCVRWSVAWGHRTALTGNGSFPPKP